MPNRSRSGRANLRWLLDLLRAILRLNVPVVPDRIDPLPGTLWGAERCRDMPELTQAQTALLLFFMEGDRKLDPIRIMKGLFIFTMEAPEAWIPKAARYHFIPYSYGPYSRQLVSDLNRLTMRGYLQQSQAAGQSWNYYSLTDAGKEEAVQVSQAFSPKAVSYLRRIREFVTSLTFRELLDSVYSKYPDYAVNSVFKS